jgi:hypothetical protein
MGRMAGVLPMAALDLVAKNICILQVIIIY